MDLAVCTSSDMSLIWSAAARRRFGLTLQRRLDQGRISMTHGEAKELPGQRTPKWRLFEAARARDGFSCLYFQRHVSNLECGGPAPLWPDVAKKTRPRPYFNDSRRGQRA